MTDHRKSTKLFEVEATDILYGLLKRISNVFQRSGAATHQAIADRIDTVLYRP